MKRSSLGWKLGLTILASVLLGGCWDRNELNELGIISATGIDWADGKWIATSQIVLPLSTMGEGTGKQLSVAPVDVFSTEGEGIRNAFRKASLETTRKLYFSHNQVVIIGESAARQGFDPLLDVYLRNMDAREDVIMFLTAGKASDILRQISPSEWNPGNGLRKLIEAEDQQTSRMRAMNIFRVISELLGPTQSTAIPEIRLSGDPETLSSVDALKRAKLDARLKLGRVGIVKRNKLVGWIKLEESYGMMWLSNHVRNGFVPYNCKGGKGVRSSSFRVIQAKTKATPYQDGGRLRMKVETRVEGAIEDFACPDDLSKLDVVDRQEKYVEEGITLLMEKGWKALKKLKTDPIGFGTCVYERYPKLWAKVKDDWDEQFAKLDPEFHVVVHIEGTGSSNPSIASYQRKP
ncbi:Ger(x)C family spore germination protein [Paenibacillus xanthanilyticus]|uniref:Ger(X)C family spore germination protein n=1 Tax=Paenibacillus xanthanilyticus TaxID=1783531 RepID=A0ABV8K6I6_9BACL